MTDALESTEEFLLRRVKKQIEQIEKLNSDNEALKIQNAKLSSQALEFQNDMESVWKLVRKSQKQYQDSKQKAEKLQDQVNRYKKIAEIIQRDKRALQECVEFYANQDHWVDNNKNQFNLCSIEDDGGSRATICLKELNSASESDKSPSAAETGQSDDSKTRRE